MKKIFYLLVNLLIINCIAQKNNKMKTFDIQKFNQNKNSKSGNNLYKYEDGDENITLIETEDSYIEIDSKKNENFSKKIIYNKNNYTPTASQNFILNMPIGTYKKYDENGEIINEINYEPNYSFSVLNFIDKIKNDFGIDVTKSKDKLTIGIQDSNTAYYFVRYPIDDIRKNSYRFIKINANTGEFISENVSYDIE